MSLPLAGERIVIGHLFADLLNLYGDHGNIATLVRRAEWRGAAVEVREIGADQGGALATVDIIFIGGGQDAQQISVAKGLEQLGGALLDAVGKGAALLAVCGGYQNLRHRFQLCTRLATCANQAHTRCIWPRHEFCGNTSGGSSSNAAQMVRFNHRKELAVL